MCEPKFKMSITLNVLNHLGINLYSNIPAVLSEIVANSWDADAENVRIAFCEDETITILDDGVGMTLNDINNKFLSVGHPKRENNNALSPTHQRPYMGRKGIGKLSMFSIAKTVEIHTCKDGEFNAFRMNVDDITRDISGENSSYYPTVLNIDNDPDLPTNGTKIILRDLKRNISNATPEFIRKRIARRFSIIGASNSFRVFVNDTEVGIEDRDYYSKLNYIWYFGEESSEYANYATEAEKKICRPNTITIHDVTYHVRGWIGTVENSGSLKDNGENLNKIVILVRGKLGQENILDEFSEGGLYSKYLIGEIHADFFDDDDKEDMATSSRQEYKRDDERFTQLRDFIYGELKTIQNDWTTFRNESGVDKAITVAPVIKDWLNTLVGDDKDYAKKMLGKVNQIVVDDQKRSVILRYSLLAFEKLRYSHRLSQIDAMDATDLEALGSILSGFDDIEATLYYQIIRERTEVIKAFQDLVDEDAKEKAIQRYLFNHLWLLDPSWERTDGTDYMEQSVLNALESVFTGLQPDEQAGRLDLGYRKTAGQHVVIELKRSDRIVKTGELIEQVKKYHRAVKKVLTDAGRNESHEIIVVLGRPVDNDSSGDARQEVNSALKPFNARIVFYTELIDNAYRAYQEYLSATRRSKPLIDVLDQLTPADE